MFSIGKIDVLLVSIIYVLSFFRCKEEHTSS